MAAIREALAAPGVSAFSIVAIGVTNQPETTILWDRKTGDPVAPAIVWQCRRTEGICKDLRRRGLSDFYHRTTGLVLDPYFSAQKSAGFWTTAICRGVRGQGSWHSDRWFLFALA